MKTKTLAVILLALSLTACGKLSDSVATSWNGYTIRCIENIKYILLSSERGLAITPAVNAEGKPLGCEK